MESMPALLVVSSTLGMFGCDGGVTHNLPRTTVTLQGRVDDGTPNSPIANAQCQVVDVRGSPGGSSTTDTNGRFEVGIPQAWKPLFLSPPALLIWSVCEHGRRCRRADTARDGL